MLKDATFTLIKIAAIVFSSYNPRKHFDPNALGELADSIQAQGIIHPPVVRPAPGKRGKFELIAGERRVRAYQLLIERGDLAKTATIPVSLIDVDEQTARGIAISENNERVGISLMEQADAYFALFQSNKSVKEIATLMGKSQAYVRQLISIAGNSSPTTRALFTQGRISLEQAEVLQQVSHDRQEAYLYRNAERQYAPEDIVEITKAEFEALGPDAYKAHNYSGEYFTNRPGSEPQALHYRVYHAGYIKNELFSEHVPVERAAFDPKAYEDRGGFISADIFGDNPVFTNRELFNTMQREVLEQQAQATEAEAKEQNSATRVYRPSARPDADAYAERPDCVSFWLEEDGELVRRDNYGPSLYTLEEAQGKLKAAKDEGKTDKAGSGKVNKKPLQLEDQAINRSIEAGLMDSHRLAREALVMMFLGADGTRLNVESPSQLPHAGYHDPRATAAVASFNGALAQAGASLMTRSSDENDLLRHADTAELSAVHAALRALSDSELETLLSAYVTLSVKHMRDTQTSSLQQHLLDVLEPTFGDFFTPDEAYLNAHTTAALKELTVELGGAPTKGNKRELVVNILHGLKKAYAAYLPPRLRQPVPEVQQDEPPFIPDAAEQLPAAA